VSNEEIEGYIPSNIKCAALGRSRDGRHVLFSGSDTGAVALWDLGPCAAEPEGLLARKRQKD
jgi:hypothetical protein